MVLTAKFSAPAPATFPYGKLLATDYESIFFAIKLQIQFKFNCTGSNRHLDSPELRKITHFGGISPHRRGAVE
jgi:hypothetical protein